MSSMKKQKPANVNTMPVISPANIPSESRDRSHSRTPYPMARIPATKITRVMIRNQRSALAKKLMVSISTVSQFELSLLKGVERAFFIRIHLIYNTSSSKSIALLKKRVPDLEISF